ASRPFTVVNVEFIAQLGNVRGESFGFLYMSFMEKHRNYEKLHTVMNFITVIEI
ncbi:UNVERIFIED_CONTAM: hypothetical protein Sindi_1283500, partial [Sesamum indicum]